MTADTLTEVDVAAAVVVVVVEVEVPADACDVVYYLLPVLSYSCYVIIYLASTLPNGTGASKLSCSSARSIAYSRLTRSAFSSSLS